MDTTDFPDNLNPVAAPGTAGALLRSSAFDRALRRFELARAMYAFEQRHLGGPEDHRAEFRALMQRTGRV